MRKGIVLVFCLLVVTVCCDQHDGHNHDNDQGHSHGDHSHRDRSQEDNSHENQRQGDHDHGDHSHGDHNHDDHGHGHHRHHDHHDHSHDHHNHGENGNVSFARDCSVHLNAGHQVSGVLRIKPQGCHHSINVLCDMETDGGGWTVIQRRGNYGYDSDYFYKSWSNYKNGFGELDKEFWIGNYHINHLTEQGNYELRIDMTNLSDENLHAQYGSFRVDNETSNYVIHVGQYSGNAGDSLSSANGVGFSTHDRDNDHNAESCAILAKGAWWYNDCGGSSLNGPHMEDAAGDQHQSIYWFNAEGHPVLLKAVKMMVRPKP